MFSGKEVCTLTCNDGYSYDTETIIAYDCGPDTMWRWNGLESVSVPACSSMYLFYCIYFLFIIFFQFGFLLNDVLCRFRHKAKTPEMFHLSIVMFYSRNIQEKDN